VESSPVSRTSWCMKWEQVQRSSLEAVVSTLRPRGKFLRLLTTAVYPSLTSPESQSPSNYLPANLQPRAQPQHICRSGGDASINHVGRLRSDVISAAIIRRTVTWRVSGCVPLGSYRCCEGALSVGFISALLLLFICLFKVSFRLFSTFLLSNVLWETYCSAGGQSPASRHWGPGSVQCQSVWEFWSTK
jgi:hypothetical protein